MTHTELHPHLSVCACIFLGSNFYKHYSMYFSLKLWSTQSKEKRLFIIILTFSMVQSLKEKASLMLEKCIYFSMFLSVCFDPSVQYSW